MRIVYKVLVALLTTLSALLLIAASFSSMVGPSKYPILTVLCLGYEYLVFLNIGMIVLAAFKNKIFAILPLVALGFGFPKPVQIVQFNTPAIIEESKEENVISLTSYNVHLFNKTLFVSDFNLRDSIEAFLIRQNSDLYVIQEFYHNDKKPSANNFERIPQKLNTPYIYFEHDKGRDETPSLFFGSVILSKYPIKESGVVVTYKGGKAQAIYADIDHPSGTIRIYNIHLQSLGFDDSEYDFLRRAHKIEIERAFEASQGIVDKIVSAAQVRTSQIIAIEDHMRGCEHPIILAGDFNETPFSFNMTAVRKYMQDGFIHKGKGLGNTFEGIGFVPPLRIDYILSSQSLKFLDFKTHPIDFSDHRPVTAKLLNTERSI